MTDDINMLDSDVQIRLDPAIVPIIVSENEVQFRAGPWAGPIVTLQDEGCDGILASVIEKFDSGTSIKEVLKDTSGVNESEIKNILSELDSKNILQRINGTLRRDPSPLPLRFSAEDLETLSSKSIMVISSGDIGPKVVNKLTNSGVGNVHAYHRQNDKTEHKFSSADSVGVWESNQTIIDTVDEVDMLVAATQQPWHSVIEEVNELAVDTATPLAHVEFTGYDIIVGPTVLPGETACYECYRNHRNNNIAMSDTYSDFEQKSMSRNRTIADLLPFADIAASFSVVDIINVLCYGHGYTVGNIISFNMSNMTMTSNDVLRYPRCQVCSDLAGTIGADSLISIRSFKNED